MTSSSAYYSNEEEVMRRNTSAVVSELHPVENERIYEVYEIERCSKYIKENRCKKVALQFPDTLLVDATKVAWQLEKNCDSKIYIMADTSYGHCDIDEVNSKHVDADLIIHYGESALTQSATVPTLHVFGRHPSAINLEEVKRSFRKAFPIKETTRIVFLHHVMCHHVANEISESLIKEYLYLSIGRLNIPTDPGGPNFDNIDDNVLKDLCTKSCPGCTCRMGDDTKQEATQNSNESKGDIAESTQNSNGSKGDIAEATQNSNGSDGDIAEATQNSNGSDGDIAEAPQNSNGSINGIVGNSSVVSNKDTKDKAESHQPDCKDYVTGFYTIPLEVDKELSDYAIFYLGPKNCQSLQNFLLSHPSCQVHVYDPESGYELLQSKSVRKLMKRYFLVEKAKDAKIVGILVGTMGVAGYLECLSYMKKIAKFSRKKTYTFIMGKLTPEKLANFLEIDTYVLIANPEHSILDMSNFYRPVITPYEFDVACNPNREWTDNYITDFREILPGGRKYVELPTGQNEEEVTVSLVTGRIRTNVDIEDNVMTSSESDAVALRNDKTDISLFGNNSSAQHLSGRSWNGLVQDIGNTEISKAKEGRSGVAVSYNELMDF